MIPAPHLTIAIIMAIASNPTTTLPPTAYATIISREINVSLKNKICAAKINLSVPTVAFVWRQQRPNIANAQMDMKAPNARSVHVYGC